MNSAGLTLAYPWVLLFGVPLLLLYLHCKRNSEAVPFVSVGLIESAPKTLRQLLRAPILFALATLTVLALLLGAARPQRVITEISPVERRNIMLALDVSRSMDAVDFDKGGRPFSRMRAVKEVVREFIENRSLERIGVVVFGSAAFLQAPITSDTNLVAKLVSRLEVGMAGDGTAIGDGLALSIKRLRDIPGKSASVILLTDGVNNSGKMDPLKASALAKELGFKVHTIGIGTPGGVLSLNGPLGMTSATQRADFDEQLLRQISSETGGVYFNAKDAEQLQSVYDEIDKLERTSEEDDPTVINEELFIYLGWSALLTYLLYLILSQTVFLKVPE